MRPLRGISAIGTLVVFILFLIIIGVLWLASGGPSRPISHAGPFLNPPRVPGVDTASGRTSGGGQSEVDTRPLPELGAGGDGEKPTLIDLFFNGQGGALTAEASPYASDVSLSKGTATNADKNKEYLVVSISKKASRSFTVSGWVLESRLSRTKVALGSAAPILFLGQINSALPITAGPGSSIYAVTGRAPNGSSFRINKCIGYLEQYQDYAPKLDMECPAPEDEALLRPSKVSSAECVDFIERLDSCELYTGDIPSNVGAACRDFIQNDLTYAGCLTLHRSDPDFFSNEWRVFLARDQELWNDSHDQILLWDENGKLIDSITY